MELESLIVKEELQVWGSQEGHILSFKGKNLPMTCSIGKINYL